ncbi:unnamed protein product [Trifolium pratense]|uniref:Uncharacterized protein n=1 Tax=Trifolium pratense TaxID=57577 RepID=A0ACB0LLA8_TRIPR|nr:unnamed protein product [Trifolium pratense]
MSQAFCYVSRNPLLKNGLLQDSKLLLDATAGGSLLSLSAADATTIIEKMSLSDRQSERSKTQRKPGILELDPSDAVLAQNKLLTNTVEELSKQMSKLMTFQEGSGKAKQVASCELCTGNHPTGHCPPSHEEVNFMANQQRQSQPTFIGGGMAPNADAGEEAGMDDDDEEDDGGEGDASMEEEDEEEADSDDD